MNANKFLDELLSGTSIPRKLEKFDNNDLLGHFDIIFFADCQTDNDVKEVISSLQKQGAQQFVKNKSDSFPAYYYVKERYDCHLANRNKGEKTKKTGCPATLLVIKYDKKGAQANPRTAWKRKGQRGNVPGKAARDAPFAVRFHLSSNHNHRMDSVDFMRNLSPDKELRESFVSAGPGGSSHPLDQAASGRAGLDEAWLADSRRVPLLRSVYYWHNLYTTATYGEDDLTSVIEKLEERRNWYKDQAIIEIAEDSVAVAIITEQQQRLHGEAWAGELVLIDATGSCDRNQSNVTQLCVVWPGGRLSVSLGYLVTSGKSEAALYNALQLYQTATSKLPKAWGGHGLAGPQVIIVDMDKAQWNALKSTWPTAIIYACIFHVMQAVDRNLKEEKNKVPAASRPLLLKTFSKAIQTPTVNQFFSHWFQLLQDAAAVSPEIYTYFDYHYNRGGNLFLYQWPVCFRSFHCRGHHTTNFVERSMRTMKEQILERIRSYNPVALIDYIVTRADFCRDTARINKIRQLHRTDKTFTGGEVKQIGPGTYLVKSETVANRCYEVVPRVGFCECLLGQHGTPCKHQLAVYHLYMVKSFGIPRFDEKSRFYAATIALGPSHNLQRHQFTTSGDTCFGGGGPSFGGPVFRHTSGYGSDLDIAPIAPAAGDDSALPGPSRLDSTFDSDQDDDFETLCKDLVANLTIARKKFGKRTGKDNFQAEFKQYVETAGKIKSPGQLTSFIRGEGYLMKGHGAYEMRVNTPALRRRKYKIKTTKALKGGRPKGGVSRAKSAKPATKNRSRSQNPATPGLKRSRSASARPTKKKTTG